METITKQIEQVAEVAGYLWQKGWAERNGGNIVINVTDQFNSQLPTDNCQLITDNCQLLTIQKVIHQSSDFIRRQRGLQNRQVLVVALLDGLVVGHEVLHQDDAGQFLQ